MQRIHSLNNLDILPATCAGTCITIGNFDGVHVGHQTLIRRMIEKAAQQKLMPTVVTFWPHPLTVLAGSRAPALLISQEERAQLFAALGVNLSLEIPFTKELAALNPEAFVNTVLVPLRCRQLIIGYDFSLGKGRAGNVHVLEELGKKYGFTVEQLSPVIERGAVVSSTRIRNVVRSGDMWEAQALLGRYYHIEGSIIHGYGRGKGLGFPTANIAAEQVLLPRQGVYVTWATLCDSENSTALPAVTNIGTAPTFDNAAMSIESFLLAGGEDMYGKRLRLSFVQHIRDEQRFENIDELTCRIAKDVALAEGILASTPHP